MARPMSHKTLPEIVTAINRSEGLVGSASSHIKNTVVLANDSVRKIALAYVELQTAAQELYPLLTQEDIELAREMVEREFKIRII